MSIEVKCIANKNFIVTPSVQEELLAESSLLVTPTFRILKPLARANKNAPSSSLLMPDIQPRSQFFHIALPLEDCGVPASSYQQLLCLYEALQNVSSSHNPYLARIKEKEFYDFIPFGHDILATYHELLQSGKPILTQIEQIIEDVVHLQWADEQKFELLKELFPAWKEAMRHSSYTTTLFAWDEFCRGDKKLDPSFLKNYSRVIFLDYQPFTPLECSILKSLLETAHPKTWTVYWQTGPDEFEHLKKYFPVPLFNIMNDPPSYPSSSEKTSIHKYSTPLNEIGAVKKKMEHHLAETSHHHSSRDNPLEDVAIITPDSETIPTFLSFFPEGILNVSVGLPLQKNPVYDLLKRWEELLTTVISSRKEKYYRIQHLFHFLFSPFIKRFLASQASLTPEEIETFFRNIYTETVESDTLLLFNNCDRLFENWKNSADTRDILLKCKPLIEKLLNQCLFHFADRIFTFTEGISHLRDVLTPVLSVESREKSSYFSHDINSAINRLHKEWEILEECRTGISFSGKDILKIHNHLLSGLSYPLPAPPEGIPVMGYKEAALLNFKAVFLPDLSDKFPFNANPEVFLNNQMRKQLGVPNQEYHYFTTKAAFENIINQAEHVYMSFPQAQQSTIPSPYIHELRLREREHEITEDDTEYSREFLQYHEPSLVFPHRDTSPPFIPPWENEGLTISELLHYMRCPLQFYLEKIKLRSEPEYHLDDTVKPPQLGFVAHQIIHTLLPGGTDFLKKYPDYQSFKDALTHQMQLRLQQMPHIEHIPTNYLSFMNLFYPSWQDFYAFQKRRQKEYSILETEKRRHYTHHDQKIRFRMDRLDRNHFTSRYCLIDYKTGRFTYNDFKNHIAPFRKKLEKTEEPDSEGLFLFNLKQHKGWDHFLEILFYGALLTRAEQINFDSFLLLYFTEQGFFQEMIQPEKEKLFDNADAILSVILSLLKEQQSPLGYLEHLNDPTDKEQRKCFRIQAMSCQYCDYQIYCEFYSRFHKELESHMFKGTS